MTLPIQDEPESTVGRKPSRWPHEEPSPASPARHGAGPGREEADEREGGPGSRERERGDPPTVQGLDE